MVSIFREAVIQIQKGQKCTNLLRIYQYMCLNLSILLMSLNIPLILKEQMKKINCTMDDVQDYF